MENIKIDINNLSNEEREQLMALIEKANKPKNKVWKPENCDVYYCLSNEGTPIIINWNNSASDINRWDVGNVFHTQEEAAEEAKRRRILTEWKRLSIESGENENEWNGDNNHFCVYYNYSGGKLTVDCWYEQKRTEIYFATKESLLNAISEIGIPNVKKYILGIKE